MLMNEPDEIFKFDFKLYFYLFTSINNGFIVVS